MMRRVIAIAAITGAFALTGCSADPQGQAESLFVEMRDMPGAEEGALTVRATNVRFDKLATAVLTAMIEYDRQKHPNIPGPSIDFDPEVAARIVSLNLKNERLRTGIKRALLEVGEARAVTGQTRDGREGMTFKKMQASAAAPATPSQSAPQNAAPADEPVELDENSPEYQAMVNTYRAFRERTNAGDFEGAKQFVRVEGYEHDPSKTWSEGRWQIEAMVLESRGRIDIDRLNVFRATVTRGNPTKGTLRANQFFESGRRVSVVLNFVIIDGEAFVLDE